MSKSQRDKGASYEPGRRPVRIRCACGAQFLARSYSRRDCDACRRAKYERRLAEKRSRCPWHFSGGKLVSERTERPRKPIILGADFLRVQDEARAELQRTMSLGLNLTILPADPEKVIPLRRRPSCAT
jgi:hypothetical protein